MPGPLPDLDARALVCTYLDPRFHVGIRIQRTRYKGQQTTHLLPDAGVSLGSITACCHRCGVTWLWQVDECGKSCWCCGDDRILPEADDGEVYDRSWFGAELTTAAG